MLVYRNVSGVGASGVTAEDFAQPVALPALTLNAGGASWVVAFAELNASDSFISFSGVSKRTSYDEGPNIGGGNWVAVDTNGAVSTFSGATVNFAGSAYHATAALELLFEAPPNSAIISAASPLPADARVLASQQAGSVTAASPLGTPQLLASQQAGLIAAESPLGVPQLLAVQQAASLQAASPLGTPSAVAAQQFAAVQAASPQAVPQLLAIQQAGSIAAPSPLGTPAALAWHDFTGSTVGAQTYVMDLVTPSGLVRVPISSWQATLQTDAASYVQCVIPAAAPWVDTILAATEFVISRRAALVGGGAVEYAMARSPIEQREPSQGPARYTVVLSGYPDALTANDDPPTAQDRTLTGVRSVAGLPGALRVRCAIDWLLRPGMRAYQGSTPILVDYINYYVPGNDEYMDVGERA